MDSYKFLTEHVRIFVTRRLKTTVSFLSSRPPDEASAWIITGVRTSRDNTTHFRKRLR
jgi:hypothetical protein